MAGMGRKSPRRQWQEWVESGHWSQSAFHNAHGSQNQYHYRKHHAHGRDANAKPVIERALLPVGSGSATTDKAKLESEEEHSAADHKDQNQISGRAYHRHAKVTEAANVCNGWKADTFLFLC
jgi:hypothetical protein